MNRVGAGICPFCRTRNVEGAPVCRHYEGHDHKKRVVRFHPS